MQIINMRLLPGLGPIAAALVMIVCTRLILRDHHRSIDPAYRLGEEAERRRRGSRRLTAVSNDIPRGSSQ